MDGKPTSVLVGAESFNKWKYDVKGKTLELNFHKEAKENIRVLISL